MSAMYSKNGIIINKNGTTGVATIKSEDGTVKVNTTTLPNGVQYDLSVNTDFIATKKSVDEVKTDLNNLTGKVDNHTTQIEQIQHIIVNNSWSDLICTPYNSNIELEIINAGYRNGFLNFNGTVSTKNETTFVTNEVNNIFTVNGVSLLIDFRNYYGCAQYSKDSSKTIFPCAMAGLKNDNLFYIFPTQTCDYFYFNGSVPAELVS